jgi:hypothetical protein
MGDALLTVRSFGKARAVTKLSALAVIGLALAAPAARADVFFLEFLAPTGNQFNYSAADRQAIADLMNADFAPFGHSVTLTQPTSGNFSRITVNATTDFGGFALTGGIAQGIDFRNTSKTDQARVNIDGLLGGTGQPALNAANVRGMTATIAAHEAGHLLGLRHGDACGCIGNGLPNRPPLTPDDYLPDYPGGFPANANETFTSIMASPASVGSTLAEATRDAFFNERSAIKMVFNDSGSVLNEQAGAHGSIATAQAVALSTLIVPNTIPEFLPGTATATVNFGKVFNVEAVAVLGNISAAGQLDFYSFTAQQGELFNFEVMSEVLEPGGTARYGNTIDTQIRIFDALGVSVPYYGGTAFNDDEFESFDSVLMDLIIPTTGTYFVRVNAFEASDTGNYELFMHRFSATTPAANVAPEPASGLLAMTGALSLLGVVRRRRARSVRQG